MHFSISLSYNVNPSDQKKWINSFESVSSVVFLISLSSYDCSMFEDRQKNQMQDALKLFEDTVNLDWFTETGFVLLFNKLDLFEEKIAKKSLKECFGDEYDEDVYYNDCSDDEERLNKNIQFIKDQFVKRIKDKNTKVLALETSAADKNHIAKALDRVLPVIAGKDAPKEIVVDVQSGTAPTVHRTLTVKQLHETKNIDPTDIDDEIDDPGDVQEISKGEAALRKVGRFVYFMVMIVYGLHILLLWPFYCILCSEKRNSSLLFQKIPIEDTFYGFSILLTTSTVLAIVAVLEIYPEIQSWMVAYIGWCAFVVFYLFNRALTVYSIFSERQICGNNPKTVKAGNFVIKYVVGVVIEKHTENNYTRPLAMVGGLFPALIVGLIANYVLEERYILQCSDEILEEDAQFCKGSVCCTIVSSHTGYFYEFAGVLASRLIASFGIVRIIGWLFCKGHPELRDIVQRRKKYE